MTVSGKNADEVEANVVSVHTTVWWQKLLILAAKLLVVFFYLFGWVSLFVMRSGEEGFDVLWLHYPVVVLYFVSLLSPILIFAFKKFRYAFMGMMLCVMFLLNFVHYQFSDLIKYDDEKMELFCAEDSYSWDKAKKQCVRMESKN